MPRRPKFDTGFGPLPSPTPDEVAQLGSRLTALRGQKDGYAGRQAAQVRSYLGGAEIIADQAAERIGEAIGDSMANSAQYALEADQRAQQAMMASLLGPTETAMSYGWIPGGSVGSGRGGRAPRRKRRRNSAPGAGLAEDPPVDPSSAETPQPGGTGALPFDPPLSLTYAHNPGDVITGALAFEPAAAGNAWPPELLAGTQIAPCDDGSLPYTAWLSGAASPVPIVTGRNGDYAQIGAYVVLAPGASVSHYYGYPGWLIVTMGVGCATAQLPAPSPAPPSPVPPFPPGAPAPAPIGPPFPPGGGPGGLPPGQFPPPPVAPGAPPGAPGPIGIPPIIQPIFPLQPPGGPIPIPKPLPPAPVGLPPLPGGLPPIPGVPPAPGVPGAPPGGVPPFPIPGAPGGAPVPGAPPAPPGAPNPCPPPVINLACPPPIINVQVGPGAPGAPGAPGMPGAPGAPGKPGGPGIPGTPGTPGAPGIPGAPAPAPSPPGYPPAPTPAPAPLPPPSYPPGAPAPAPAPPSPTGVGQPPYVGPIPEPPPEPGPSGPIEDIGDLYIEEGVPHGPVAGTPIASCLPGADIIEALAGKDLRQILVDAGAVNESGNWVWYERVIGALAKDESWSGAAQKVAAGIGEFLLSGLARAGILLQQGVAKGSLCDQRDTATAALIQIIIGVVRKWVADLPPALTRGWDHYVNWVCPVALPGAEWANEALAHNRIGDGEWECLVRADGAAKEWQRIDATMRAQRITDDQLILLDRKGQLIQGDSLDSQLRLSGWTQSDQLEYAKRAAAWVPSPTDAVEWMIKDVADPQIQQTFLLDSEFAQKYSGHVKEVFDWQGISREDADNIWRAHWRNMSPHTLYELHKRLRPGWTNFLSDKEVINLTEAIAPRKSPLVTPEILAQRPISGGFPVPTYVDELPDPATAKRWLESLATSGYHVSEALGQADYPPFWRQRLLAVSYNVLTRVDMRRGYETGQVSPEQLVSQLQDRGYTPTDSANLSGQWREAAIQLHMRRPAANSWVKDGYDMELLKQALMDQGMREDMWEAVRARLEIRRQIYIQVNCINGIKKRYLIGVITDDGVQAQLLSIGLAPSRIGDLLNDWRCLRRAAPKQETAQNICTEFKAGLLTGNQASALLRGLGYTRIQARRILSLCYLRPTPKGLKHVPAPGTKEAQEMEDALNS